MERLKHFDNVKFLLVLLVVIGHFTDRCIGTSHLFKAIYSIIYLFHMPAFLFVCGIFSHNTINSKAFPKQKILQYLFLYIDTKILFWLMRAVYSYPLKFSLFTESELPWFFLTLIFCYCVTWLMKKMDCKSWFILSVILGCLIGYDNTIGDFLALSRCITYYPFFLMGAYFFRADYLTSFLSKWYIRCISAIWMLILIIYIFQNAELFYTARNFFKGNTPYSQIDVIANGGGLRLLYYIIVTGCILAFISIVPKCHVFFTPYGKRTLTIMVLHIPVKELVQHCLNFGK